LRLGDDGENKVMNSPLNKLTNLFVRKGDAAETTSGEPQPIGELLPNVDPKTPRVQRLTQSMEELTALLDKAGQLLEIQAKRQQQMADSLAELPALIREQTQRTNDNGQAIEQLARKIEPAVRVGEAISQLATAMDGMGKSHAAGVDLLDRTHTRLAESIDRVNDQLARQVRVQRLATWAAIVVSAVVLAVALVVLFLK
jgi:hypothetical protein